MKKSLIISGKNIYLKEFQVGDITADYINWLNDPEVNQYLESRHVKQTKKTVEAYVRSFAGCDRKLLFGIFDRATGLHVGNISFSDLNHRHGYGVIGIAVGRKAFWGKGIGTEAIELLVAYGFKILKLKRIEAGIYANNLGSIAIFKKAGFKIEAALRERYQLKNKRVDGLIVGFLKEDWSGA
ncbi:MAG: GNAT family N-acetyltransferase [Candidatus Margulisbacteria bacterium]|nr:GNAT family N-acetyltransferase [Candidatus Margulisiibacteriota bacterium]